MVKLYYNSTKERPLLFFESFINKQSLEKFEDMFFGYPVNDSQVFNLKAGYIEYMKDTYVDEVFKPVRVYFKDELQKLLLNNLSSTFKFIEDREIELIYQNISSDIFIERQFYIALKIKNLAGKLVKYSDIVMPFVSDLEKYITSKRKQPQLTELKFKNFNNPSRTYFELKEGVTKKTLKELYKISVQHEIIDRFLFAEKDFLSVFQNTLLPITDLKFIFFSDNRKAIVYLKSISPLFKNFTPSRIAESKTFFTKQRGKFNSKLINANDFNKVSHYLNNATGNKYEALVEGIKKLFPAGI